MGHVASDAGTCVTHDFFVCPFDQVAMQQQYDQLAATVDAKVWICISVVLDVHTKTRWPKAGRFDLRPHTLSPLPGNDALCARASWQGGKAKSA